MARSSEPGSSSSAIDAGRLAPVPLAPRPLSPVRPAFARRGYRHVWGVGRHLLGSQIFDYWEDPWRRVHEHWTDTDVLNARSGSAQHPVEIGLSTQWGEPPPQSFVELAIA